MAKKTTKKVNVKEQFKNEIFNILTETFNQLEIEFDVDYQKYGFTKNTIIVKGAECDIQIKLVTPKAGINRYNIVEEED